jgi:hypothetical protein
VKTITVENVIAFRPCDDYPESRVRKIAGDKKEWSALDILALEEIPAEDRLRAVLRPELIADRVLHLFMCEVAEGALALDENPHPASTAAPAAKRKWLAGEITDEELAAAYAAARDAAWAAEDTAWDAAWDDAQEEQVQILVRLLTENRE